MEANSSGLDNTILLYVAMPSEDNQLIQQKIQHIIGKPVIIKNDAQLKQLAHNTDAQIVIIIGNPSLDILDSIKHLTLIYITDDPDQADETLFDYILKNDDHLIYHLQQIAENQALRTRIKELETQLSTERMNSNHIEILKEAIVRNVSHELKTPLLHVKSAVSLMAEDIGKDNKLIRYAENATARLETIVTNITMFGSSLNLNLGPVIVRDSVEYAHRNLYRIWESKDQAKRIILHVDKDLPPVRGDRQGLSTILQLLLDNALKFSEGEIEVHAHLIGHEVEFSVKDYGIGISPDQLNTIFDSFYQVDSSSTRRYGGTGVGLALVKILIESHMSEIKVISQLNHGSTFSFRLEIIRFT